VARNRGPSGLKMAVICRAPRLNEADF